MLKSLFTCCYYSEVTLRCILGQVSFFLVVCHQEVADSEYSSIAWNPYTCVDTHILEMVQNRAARWICTSWNPVIYAWSKSTNDCLRELTWPSLAQHRVYFIVDYFHSILNHRNSYTFMIILHLRQFLLQGPIN